MSMANRVYTIDTMMDTRMDTKDGHKGRHERELRK